MQPRITALLSRPSPKFQCLIRSSQKLPYSTAQSQGLERPPSKSSSSDARWLGDIKKRIGKCVIFGMSREQTQKAAGILKILGEEWRELVAGREGFLTDVKSAGLRRHKVVWGEMDSMVCLHPWAFLRKLYLYCFSGELTYRISEARQQCNLRPIRGERADSMGT